jgi:hypothetical protein
MQCRGWRRVGGKCRQDHDLDDYQAVTGQATPRPAGQPDPLVHAAVRLLDAVEADLFPTAEDITEQGTPRPPLDALVALVPRTVAAVSGRRWPRAGLRCGRRGSGRRG